MTDREFAIILYGKLKPITNLRRGRLTDADIVFDYELALNSLSLNDKQMILAYASGTDIPMKVLDNYLNIIKELMTKDNHRIYIDVNYDVRYANYSLSSFNISKRVLNKLKEDGVVTVNDFIQKYRLNHDYVESIKGLGREAFYELQNELLNKVLFP